MTLLFVDGFDHYATEDITKKWTSITSSPTILPTGGRRGGGGVRTSSQHVLQKTLPGSYSTLVVGFSFNPTATSAARDFLRLYETGTMHVGLRLNVDLTISMMRSTTVLATSVAALTLNAEQYVEFKCTIHDSTGAYEVRVNGVNVLSASGVDTRNGGTGVVNALWIGSISTSGHTAVFDDLYVCDTTGSTNNDFLGDCRVDTMFPTSDGTYTNFTPSAGSDHYALVDEASVNTTDYNDGAASGDRDSYGMGNLSAIASSTIFGIQVAAALQNDDAGARSAGTMVRSGIVNSDGAGRALSTSQIFVSEIYEQDPDATAAWTEATVNAMQAGVKVTA